MREFDLMKLNFLSEYPSKIVIETRLNGESVSQVVLNLNCRAGGIVGFGTLAEVVRFRSDLAKAGCVFGMSSARCPHTMFFCKALTEATAP